MYDKAESLFKSISALYSTDGWESLVFFARTRLGSFFIRFIKEWSEELILFSFLLLAKCQQQLKHHVDYVSSCLGLLSQDTLDYGIEGKIYYFNELTTVVRESLPSGNHYSPSSAFRSKVPSCFP